MKKQEKANKALHNAAYKGDVNKLEAALKDGADVNAIVNAYPTEGWTALFLAANRRNTECVDILLKSGANVKHKSAATDDPRSSGSTVLHAMLTAGDPPETALLIRLLDEGAEVDAATADYDTPLGLAADNGYIECVKVLLERGAKAHHVQGAKTTVLWQATRKTGNREIVKLLLGHGAPVDVMNDFHATPLMSACKAGDSEIVALLLERGASVEYRDDRGLAPLHHACDFGNTCRSEEGHASAIAIMEMLLNAGAKTDVKDNNGRTPPEYFDDPSRKPTMPEPFRLPPSPADLWLQARIKK